MPFALRPSLPRTLSPGLPPAAPPASREDAPLFAEPPSLEVPRAPAASSPPAVGRPRCSETKLPILPPVTARRDDHQSDRTAALASPLERRTPRFETAPWLLQPVPEPDSRRLEADLALVFPNGYGVSGADPGSSAELGLRYLLYRVSPSLSSLTVQNLLVPDLDFRGNLGRVLLQVDALGSPSAHLVGFGEPHSSVQFESREEARRRILEDFRLGAVTDDGVASWGRRELQKVYAAFERMPERERQALSDVELHRAKSNATPDAPLRIGYFAWSSGISGGVAEEKAKLSLDDRVFSIDASSFAGEDLPASFNCILHEAGHAVESMEVRRALLALNRAVARYNGKVLLFNAMTAEDQATARPELDALEREVDSARGLLSQVQRPDGRSETLAGFEAYVAENQVEPPTRYAATSASDFFAESYMLHRTEGDLLARVNSQLSAYFQARDAVR